MVFSVLKSMHKRARELGFPEDWIQDKIKAGQETYESTDIDEP